MAFVDWLQWTIKKSYKDGEESLLVAELFSCLPYSLQELIGFETWKCSTYTITTGLNYYQSSLLFSCGLRVLYNPPRANMGTNFIISGDLLKSLDMDEVEIAEWYANLQQWDYSITRVDIAFDTDVDFLYFHRKTLRKEFICSYRHFDRNVDENFRGTLYFGKRGKGSFFRIYDKYLEQYNKLKSSLKKKEFEKKYGGKPWTRIEGEFRHEMARQIINEYISGNVGQYFLGHLRFVKEMKSNKTRCETDEIYTKIVKADFGRKLSNQKKNDINLDWIVTVFGYVNALRKFNPTLYDLLLSGVQVSPTAYGKFEDNSAEVERFEHTLKDYIRNQQKERWKMQHIIDSSSFDKVYIDGEIPIEECAI